MLSASCYATAHDGDGTGSAESHHGVGVLHQFRQNLAALAGECLQLLPGQVGSFGGETLEFVADVGVVGRLGQVGGGGEEGQGQDLVAGQMGQLHIRAVLRDFPLLCG